MTSTSDWQADLRRARSGDQEALGRILDAVRNYLRQIARKELPQDLRAKEDESDIVQEAFAKASQSFTSFHGGSASEWEVWLRSILLHVLNSSRRRFHTRKRGVGREQSLSQNGSQNNLADRLAALQGEPVEAVIEQDRVAALAAAVARLPEHYRAVLAMRLTENLSFVVIGTRLGIGENAAQKLWMRTLERLHKDLGESF